MFTRHRVLAVATVACALAAAAPVASASADQVPSAAPIGYGGSDGYGHWHPWWHHGYGHHGYYPWYGGHDNDD